VPIDYALLALTSSREAFVAACPFPFLVGRVGAPKPARRHLTIDPRNQSYFEKTASNVVAVSRSGSAELSVLAVRKVQETFPTMVSVGRTANNDIVINHPLVSKFHAFFRLGDGGRVELFEAGSKNGTFVGDLQLAAKEPRAVRSGDEVRFAELTYQFLDAGPAWDRVHREKRA
jgi:pSer/pThr/pTyr-binding forkhead associated (FHA) protein